MPWCTTCDRFLSPSTVPSDGACPTCGRPVDPGRADAPAPSLVAAPAEAGPEAEVEAAVDPRAEADDDRPPLPWHLWLLLAALTVYLGYRAFQGLEWVFGF